MTKSIMKLVHKDTKRGRGSGNPTYKKKGIYPAVPCVVLITLRFFLTQNINNNCNIPIKDQLKLTLLSSGQSFFLIFSTQDYSYHIIHQKVEAVLLDHTFMHCVSIGSG